MLDTYKFRVINTVLLLSNTPLLLDREYLDIIPFICLTECITESKAIFNK